MATAESTSCYVPVARFFKTPCMGPCGRDDCGSCRYETIYCTVSKRSLSAEEQKSLYSDDGHNDVLKDDAIVERMRTIKLCPECYDDKLFDAPGVRFEHFVIKGRRAGAGGGGGVIAIASADRNVRVWDPRSGLISSEAVAVQLYSSHGGWVTSVAWHPTSEHHLASASTLHATLNAPRPTPYTRTETLDLMPTSP
mmetsp:Transcript_39534/g.126126  ORF Transcript_39534/g.126126 Transcript_39534/m.126126 type:complete len:196 (+) Transcript_39534:372-959(+)